MSASAFRIGVIGAARRRQGTGPFLARFLHAAGARVVAICGTTTATANQAAADLRTTCRMILTPYSGARAMIAKERLDALAIASPAATHLAYLDLALASGCHALCEKPLVWGGADPAGDAARLVTGFSAKGLLLAVATQWRHGLGAYMQLFPDVVPRSATSFEMTLSPTSTGRDMVPDALPHAFSILDHLFPAHDRPLSDLKIDASSRDATTVSFTHPGGAAGIACVVRLATVPSAPRPFGFGFDGRFATRVVTEPGYRISLRDAATGREVPLSDPLDALVKAFVASVRRGPPFPVDPVIATGVRRLVEVASAWPP